MEAYFYKCRRAYCDNPATDEELCCSEKCKKLVPRCSVSGCETATEQGTFFGSDIWYSKNCYEHGGRIEIDGVPRQDLKTEKMLYRYENGKWKLVRA